MEQIVAIGSDHAGFELKEIIKQHLQTNGINHIDLGTDSADAVDYPDFAAKVGHEVAFGHASYGILCCGTGIGMEIAANKMKGIRAANCLNTTMARFAREHNNANVLCLGSRIIGSILAIDIVNTFLNSVFTESRHLRRINKIISLEEGNV